MRLPFVLGLVLLLVSSCAASAPCGSGTCDGCCSAGQCITATSAVSCGASGSLCTQCIPGQVCLSGLCASPGASTGGDGGSSASDFLGGWKVGGVVQWTDALGPRQLRFANAPMVVTAQTVGVFRFELSTCVLTFTQGATADAVVAQTNTFCNLPGDFMIDLVREDGGTATSNTSALRIVLTQATATSNGSQMRIVGRGGGGFDGNLPMTFDYTATR